MIRRLRSSSPDWFQCAAPFPHLIEDHVLTREIAVAVAAEFPDPDDFRWKTFSGPLEEGKQQGATWMAGPLVSEVHHDLISPDFVDYLRQATGVEGLSADPDLYGGGIHQHGPGARLGLHVDFDVDRRRPTLVRAVNVILFVSAPKRGGWLMFHNAETGAWKGIEPIPGRLVIFESSARSWHGHPIPTYAGDTLRRSIAAYYYRPLAEGEVPEGRSTRFLETT